MDILIINHNGGSIYHGPNLRTYYAAKELVKQGHKVTIVSSSYSHKYGVLPKINGEITPEVIDGIEYRWVRCVKYKSLIQRIYSHFQFGFKCIRNLDKICNKADVVLFSGPPPEIFLFARRIAKKLNAPIVSDIRDLWPRTQIEMSKLQWLNPFTYFLFLCQFLLVKGSDRLVSPLPGVGKYLTKVGAPGATCIIENGFDISRDIECEDIVITISGCSNDHSFQQGSSIPLSQIREFGGFVVGYAGGFDRDNDLDVFLDAAKALKSRKDIVFLMVGAGIRKQEVIDLARSTPNLVVAERVKSSEVPFILSGMDVCFCGLKSKSIYQYGVSLAKSYEYMAAAKPIIWMVDACNNPIEASGGGWSVAPGNVSELVAVIESSSAMDKSELLEIGNKARKYLESHNSYDVLGLQWLELFSSTAR